LIQFASRFKGMTDTIASLKAKRENIIHTIRLYEKKIEQAAADLAHISAAIKIFEASGEAKDIPRYVDTYRIFKRGEQIELCKHALASGPKTTTELARCVMKVKGFDASDRVLVRAVTARLIHALRMQALRGRICRDKSYAKGGTVTWSLPEP
jgi:hypothetical protein